MEIKKLLRFMIIGGASLMLLGCNTRNSRAYLENRVGTEVSRVYPTQNLEDLFEQFPNGFIGLKQECPKRKQNPEHLMGISKNVTAF